MIILNCHRLHTVEVLRHCLLLRRDGDRSRGPPPTLCSAQMDPDNDHRIHWLALLLVALSPSRYIWIRFSTVEVTRVVPL